MGRFDGEGSPIQPDGGLLSVLGDLLFAGAILVMIYPFLRRTVDRIDRHFFRQFFYIMEVLLAVGALCFVLMLLIAQQMRVTYCSLIRPYVGDRPEDKAYAGVYLKILVCALLVFNYFCASWLQRAVSSFFSWFQPGGRGRSVMTAGRFRRPRTFSSREVLTNNSNTNSQTPVTHTLTHSDILPSMSFPAIHSDSFQEHDDMPVTHARQRLYRDVGTMVRFPEYQSSLCTLQFCRGVMTDGPETFTSPTPGHGPGPSSSFIRPGASKSTMSVRHPMQGMSMGFSTELQSGLPSGLPVIDHSGSRLSSSGHGSHLSPSGVVSMHSDCQVNLTPVRVTSFRKTPVDNPHNPLLSHSVVQNASFSQGQERVHSCSSGLGQTCVQNSSFTQSGQTSVHSSSHDQTMAHNPSSILCQNNTLNPSFIHCQTSTPNASFIHSQNSTVNPSFIHCQNSTPNPSFVHCQNSAPNSSCIHPQINIQSHSFTNDHASGCNSGIGQESVLNSSSGQSESNVQNASFPCGANNVQGPSSAMDQTSGYNSGFGQESVLHSCSAQGQNNVQGHSFIRGPNSAHSSSFNQGILRSSSGPCPNQVQSPICVHPENGYESSAHSVDQCPLLRNTLLLGQGSLQNCGGSERDSIGSYGSFQSQNSVQSNGSGQSHGSVQSHHSVQSQGGLQSHHSVQSQGGLQSHHSVQSQHSAACQAGSNFPCVSHSCQANVQCHSNVCVYSNSVSQQMACSSHHSVAATFNLPRQRTVVRVRRRRSELPSMPKMTRSGKIYGYG